MKNLKQITLTIALNLLSGLWLFCQDYDMQWIQSCVPTSIMDFRNDTIQFHFVNDTILSFNSTANICDKQGNFLFFTNGIYVYDRNGTNMPGGNWLSYYNPSHYFDMSAGTPNNQSVLILK